MILGIEQKKKEVRSYYEKITGYLKKDLSALMLSDDKGYDVGCGPYILTTCSGIDNLGEIFAPRTFRRNAAWFKFFIREYLGKVQQVYQNNKVDTFIYKVIRCGQIHEAIVKPGVLIGKQHKEYHLKILKIAKEWGSLTPIKLVFFNVRSFAEDFLASLKYCEEKLKDDGVIVKSYDFLVSRDHKNEKIQRKFQPKLEEVEINYDNFSTLYQSSSSSPRVQGGTYLKEEFWQEFV